MTDAATFLKSKSRNIGWHLARMDAMEGFDTMAMSYMGNPVSAAHLSSDYLQTAPGMDMPDHLSNFDADPYMRSVP